MVKFLLMGLASFSVTAVELPVTTPATCTAAVSGPTFGLGGGMYFYYTTTCTAPVESITIDASITGPTQRVGTKRCTETESCTFVMGVPYKRGTWTWTNDSTFPGGTDSATQTVTYSQ